MNLILTELRHAARGLARTPGFTAVAVLTLALGIGVNSAIFSLVHALVFKPLVPHAPERFVGVFCARQGAQRDYRPFSFAEFLALRQPDEVMRDVAAFKFALAGLGRDGDAVKRSFVVLVTENYLPLAGVQPVVGRQFTAEEARPGANVPVAIASHSLWQRSGARPDFVGSQILVNQQPVTIIGIAPVGFSGLNALLAPDLWLPLGLYGLVAPAGWAAIDAPDHHTLSLAARLQDGLTLETARARLGGLSAALNDIATDRADGARELQLFPVSRYDIGDVPGDNSVGFVGLLLNAMAGVVLVIACLNLANMLLARGTARRREFAVRLALGASRKRIVRQLLLEGLLLALAGGALGLLVSTWSNVALVQSVSSLFASMSFSFTLDPRPEPLVLAATLAFSFVATLFFSLGPALRSTRVDLVSDLKQQAGAAGAGRWNRFFAARHVLVMAQMALSVMLLFAAGLFVQGAWRAAQLDPRLQPDGVIVAEFDYRLTRRSEADSRTRLTHATERLAQLPGIAHVAFASELPFGNGTTSLTLQPAGAPLTGEDGALAGTAGVHTVVTGGHFALHGLAVLQGRTFTPGESTQPGGPPVVVVDELMARALFPEGDALGRRVRRTLPGPDGLRPEYEIVGIVQSSHHQLLEEKPPARFYVPAGQSLATTGFLQLRVERGDPGVLAALLPLVRRELLSVDPQLPLLQLTPYPRLIDRNLNLWLVRLAAAMFGVFGAVSLLLATLGVYGVKAYAVARRTSEIGIRMAIGASPRDVQALLLRESAAQIGVALAAGILLALLGGRVLAGMLYRVSPLDLPALATAVLSLAAAALLACWIPARRATRVDPLAALRAE